MRCRCAVLGKEKWPRNRSGRMRQGGLLFVEVSSRRVTVPRAHGTEFVPAVAAVPVLEVGTILAAPCWHPRGRAATAPAVRELLALPSRSQLLSSTFARPGMVKKSRSGCTRGKCISHSTPLLTQSPPEEVEEHGQQQVNCRNVWLASKLKLIR